MIDKRTRKRVPRHERVFVGIIYFTILVAYTSIFDETVFRTIVQAILFVAILALVLGAFIPENPTDDQLFNNPNLKPTSPNRIQRAALVMIVLNTAAAFVYLFFPITSPFNLIRQFVIISTLIGMSLIGLCNTKYRH